jgi:monoamine oxidase
LSFLDRGASADSIILNAIEQIVPGITASGLTEEQRRKLAQEASFAGLPLYKQGFWNVLLRVINGEAYQLGVDAGGYNSTLSNWNAADAIPWYLSDFGIDPQYKGFRKGFQQVPKALAQLFAKKGEIRLETPVSAVRWQDGGFEFLANGQPVKARQLILAMPRRSIDLLAATSPILHEFQRLTASVTPRPLFKLFTTYNNPWWLAAGYTNAEGQYVAVEAGRSVTDLPVRQTYYWPKSNGDPATAGERAMLLASYDDGTNTGFWDGLRPQRHLPKAPGQDVAPLPDPFIGEAAANAESVWNEYRAPRLMVQEVARQLGTMHGLNYTPKVLNAAFRDWGDDPFGGGWNSWNIGVKSWEVKRDIIKPLGSYPLYICGEAYSDAQGWVEGALQTAGMMLEKISH